MFTCQYFVYKKEVQVFNIKYKRTFLSGQTTLTYGLVTYKLSFVVMISLCSLYVCVSICSTCEYFKLMFSLRFAIRPFCHAHLAQIHNLFFFLFVFDRDDKFQQNRICLLFLKWQCISFTNVVCCYYSTINTNSATITIMPTRRNIL